MDSVYEVEFWPRRCLIISIITDFYEYNSPYEFIDHLYARDTMCQGFILPITSNIIYLKYLFYE